MESEIRKLRAARSLPVRERAPTRMQGAAVGRYRPVEMRRRRCTAPPRASRGPSDTRTADGVCRARCRAPRAFVRSAGSAGGRRVALELLVQPSESPPACRVHCAAGAPGRARSQPR
jgi:hypothetical protein